MATRLSKDELKRVFNHIFLPPKLPQSSDETERLDKHLVQLMLKTLQKPEHSGTSAAINNAMTAMRSLEHVNSLRDGSVSETELEKAIIDLEDGHTVPVYVRAQNAGILISGQLDTLIFEVFELSPRNSAVVNTKGRLIRCFPGAAVSVKVKLEDRSRIAPALAEMISKMSQTLMPGMQPTALKGAVSHDEFRDTTSPAAVTELLVSYLKGFGQPVSVSAISKNTRDEVLWSNSKAPWRRSSMWLLIKVTLHLVVRRSRDGDDRLYKLVMLALMSCTLDSALEYDSSSEDLHAMKAKIVRRLRKLRSSGIGSQEPVLSSIEQTLHKASTRLSDRWALIQREDNRQLDLHHLSTLSADTDTQVALPALERHISLVQCRPSESAIMAFVPSSKLISQSADKLPTLPEDGSHELRYATANLQGFELWIAQHLDLWLSLDVNHDVNTCQRLHRLMEHYHRLANSHYAGNPEGVSIMVLTVFELWVACDKAAIKACPMLAEYAHGIPLDVLENLLLPFESQTDRLLKVERYFKDREERCSKSLARYLLDTSTPRAFAARFYDSSLDHQNLHEVITKEAERHREEKLAEYDRTKAEYTRLDNLVSQLECQYRRIMSGDPPIEKKEHANECQRCALQRQRDSLSITIHEWPLPSDSVKAKVVVFELRVPSWYTSWRDARLYILQSVLGGNRRQANYTTRYLLSENDPHLTTKYTPRDPMKRIDLLSTSKPAVVTHYGAKNIATLERSETCVPNGLDYKYFFKSSSQSEGPFEYDNKVFRSCTYTLPDPELQRYVFRPAHSFDGEPPNAAIASQDKCPGDMSLDEFRELSHVPLGHHIQWANMLLQLAMPGVDFKQSATTLVFLQCMYQTGPLGNTLQRQAHAFVRDNSNATSVLYHLDKAVEKVKQNWESAQALELFSSITSRVLSLNGNMKTTCLTLLAKIRNITVHWMHSLEEAIHVEADYVNRTTLVSKSVEIALICASTFDVDQKYISETFANPAPLIRASILIQQNATSKLWTDAHLKLLRLRFARLLHRCQEELASKHHALDEAVGQSWTSYKPGPVGWIQCPGIASNWMTTTTSDIGGKVVCLHYNLLDGELLVNGLPLDKPPENYREHSLYKELFSGSAVEVMPATTTGFRFSTKRRYGMYEVQLGMHLGKELIVKASCSGGVVDHVPRYAFAGMFPTHFVKDYVHWYNSSTAEVEFRPVTDPWNTMSTGSWTLKRFGQTAWRLMKDKNYVVGLGTPTHTAMSEILSPLADPCRIHCILQSVDESLKIDIPALRLGFSRSKGDSNVRSKEFQPMSIDVDQSLGTLIGFSNRLLLKSQDDHRIVLLAEADLAYSAESEHMSVRVESTESIRKVHAIHIDGLLHRLIDNGDLSCKMYLAYVHALTSFCLPDPLTCTTGIEQSLSILRSGAVRSFEQLSDAHMSTLVNIAHLSPRRHYYPPHERVMQSITWNSQLGFLTQHSSLRLEVEKLFQQAREANLYFPDAQLSIPELKSTQSFLQERDSIRSATFRIDGFGAEEHTLQHDQQYDSRDLHSTSPRASNAAFMSGLMLRDGTELHWPAASLDELWNKLHAVSDIHGPRTNLDHPQVYRANLVKLEEYRELLGRFPSHLQKLAGPHTQQEKYRIAAWLATLAFGEQADTIMLQVLAMATKCQSLAQLSAPNIDKFQLNKGKMWSERTMRAIVSQNTIDFGSSPEVNLPRLIHENKPAHRRRRETLYNQAKDTAVTRFVAALLPQWPCDNPTTPDIGGRSKYIRVRQAMAVVTDRFRHWRRNIEFNNFLIRIADALGYLTIRSVQLPPSVNSTAHKERSVTGYLSVRDVFSTSAPRHLRSGRQSEMPGQRMRHRAVTSNDEPLRLRSMLDALEMSTRGSSYEFSYAADLRSSLAALARKPVDQPTDTGITLDILVGHRDQCKHNVRKLYEQIVTSINSIPNSAAEQGAQHMPRLSPILLLQQLAWGQCSILSPAWKICIVQYGVAITALQQSERLLRLMSSGQSVELAKELQNPGHENWNPHDHPESLLMEIESGILIRKVQEQIASQMRAPPNGDNAVMQLNMGEGKSTRHHSYGGSSACRRLQIVGRRIHYMPFSRSLKLDRAAMETICASLQQCMKSGGILLVQPEHILSFRLMAPECLISGRDSSGHKLMEAQDFFDKHSRDIVDESDENFSVRFELIYTMGIQQPVEASPDRWATLHQVLDLVQSVVHRVATALPSSIEVSHISAGGFPRVRILRPDAANLLVLLISRKIRDEGMPSFHVSRLPPEDRLAVFQYITEPDLDDRVIGIVENSKSWNAFQVPILLLRGMLAGGILTFALSQKRWRVNYGLALRTPPTKLAVPFRAKDSPSLRSEFSHPDVVIILTSLCYYYGGLSDSDMFVTMDHLIGSDNASAEYELWCQHAKRIPAALCQLQGVNMKDKIQCTTQLFPHLRGLKAVVDYFLAHIVFPKEMREFPHKLSASGWDIGKQKTLCTTGFSGTNDSRRLLPLHVTQLDLEEQKHTNALVLEYLLQPINGIKLLTAENPESTSDAEELLSAVARLEPPVQVILDVGAQILELDNLGVADAWLHKSDLAKEAVVFVDDHDELCVLDRKGRVELLQTSPFASRLDVCLVFLDESHTRGIDLRLPTHYRAAVTLGAHLTKDRLVQACMRMRKLGKGQSVVFCISREIEAKIQEAKTDPANMDITVSDVLLWSILETHAEIRRSMPLWVVQGERFVRQEKVWKSMVGADGSTHLSVGQAETLLEEEAQSIEHRYRPRVVASTLSQLANSPDPDLKRIAARCLELDDLKFDVGSLEEEQERELSPEVEREREVQKASPAEPARHSLHRDVERFALAGIIDPSSPAYMPAFESLAQTSAAKELTLSQLAGARNFLVSSDFATTIQKSSARDCSDGFQRHVQWVLSRCEHGRNVIQTIMLISPFEANQLWPGMSGAKTTLHLYKARSNSTYMPLDKLDLLQVPRRPNPPAIPRSLSIQLGLFAGQLYISTYADYVKICSFLGLSAKLLTKHMQQQGWKVSADGFILSDGNGSLGGTSGLTKTPVNFFKVLMAKIRRNGEGIAKTHMGDLLEGKLFTESDWEQ